MALIFGVLAFFLYDHILIQSTALFGSFLFVYGVGMVAGGYQNPFTIVELIKYGQLDSIDPIFYAYLGGNVLMYILGCVIQYRHKRNHPDHDPEKDIRKRYGGRRGRR
jgi:hypothetical protein